MGWVLKGTTSHVAWSLAILDGAVINYKGHSVSHSMAVGQTISGGSDHIWWVRPCLVGQTISGGSDRIWWVRPYVVGQTICDGSDRIWWVRPYLLGQTVSAGSDCI